MKEVDQSENSMAMFCDFDIQRTGDGMLKESRRQVERNGHTGMIYEAGTADGLYFGYYNVQSSNPGKVIIANANPFVQLSYTISGAKSYDVQEGNYQLASFKKKEYNYLFFTSEQIHLNWEPGERLEIFELAISPETMLRLLPEEHPFYSLLNNSMESNRPAVMSHSNLFLQARSSAILYDMLNCPLDGRYKQLYLKSKLGELLSMELGLFEQTAGMQRGKATRPTKLKQEEIERMHHARDIILSNLNSPCSLIDLAHQVGTNDAYLKRHFKEVFGATVFGYLHVVKMGEARKLLSEGLTVSEVASLTGYKHVGHFTRAFKKYFGINPNQVKR